MADVLLGRADGLDGFERHVVLKRIKSEHARDEHFIQMFLDEARIAASLHHANIVQVHDVGETNGEYFFAMEYVHGEDLRKLLSRASKNRTHMPLGIVCAVVAGAAAGLHYAHERRGNDKRPMDIVHRDVSPSNIIVGYDGSVKVLDFGIAKAAQRQLETRAGSLKGKVSYMSPEQCKGNPVDRRSDIFALGILLYELATTSRLFKGDNDYLLMDAIVNGKIPLPQVRRPDLPNELSQIIMTALSIDAGRRYQTADELRTALEQFALRNGFSTSQSALAAYIQKQFGDKPEPWLDLGSEVSVPNATWTEIPAHNEQAPMSRPSRPRTESKQPRAESKPTRSSTGVIGPHPTRTSMRMGWEAQGPVEPEITVQPAPSRRHWAPLVGLPLAAFLGIAVWHFGFRSRAHTTVAAAGAPAGTSPSMTPPPAPAAPIAATPVAAAPVAAAPMAAPAAPAAPVQVAAAAPRPAADESKTVSRPKQTAPKKAGPEKVAVAEPEPAKPAPPPAQPAIAAPAPVVAAPPPAPAPAPVAAAPPPAAVAASPTPPPAQPAVAAPPPATVDVQIAQLSQATVQMVAGDHSRQLGKCDAFAENVHGEVSVAFQVDGSGKVVKSQLSSTAKNPKLAACILKTVSSWQFPKPPTGAAKGVYSIDYQ